MLGEGVGDFLYPVAADYALNEARVGVEGGLLEELSKGPFFLNGFGEGNLIVAREPGNDLL